MHLGPPRAARLSAPITLVLLLAACAHAAPPRADAAGVRVEPKVHDATPTPSEPIPTEVAVGEVTVVIRHRPEDAAVAAQLRLALPAAASVAQRWGALPSRVTVTVHPTHDALEVATRHPDHPWLRAWARLDSIDLQSPRSWSRGEATDAELVQLLSHELTHCAMYAALGGDRRLAREIPPWFREGMATTNAGEHLEGAAGVVGTDALRPTAAQYRDDALPVYAAAHRAFGALEQRYERDRIREVLARVRAGVRFADAFEQVLGITLNRFERELGAAATPPSIG